MPVTGRPSKYQECFCEQIEAHMSKGFSASSFAGTVGVSMDTISEWRKVHPDFSEAVKRGQAMRVQYWEDRLIKSSKADAIPIIFALKNINPDEWRDKRDVELAGPGGTSLFPPEMLLAAQDVARKLQIVDVQTVAPKQIVDVSVKKEE